VTVHAGGGVFANGKRGDGIWMFSLDGKMESMVAAPAAGARAGGPPAGGGAPAGVSGPAGGTPAAMAGPTAASGTERSSADHARAVDRGHGETIYKQACVPCHGESGAGGHGGGPSLIAGQTAEKIVSVTSTGKNNMPAFAATYSPDDMRDIAAYIIDGLARKQ
jgi:quinohemoprotein ethanol dehydrogenase